MTGAAVRRSVWLICNTHSFDAVSPRLTAATPPTGPARMTTKMFGFSSAAAYFLIFNRGFCSNFKASGSGTIDLGGKDNSSAKLTALLKSYAFAQAQIDEIIKRFPRILSCRISTNLKPKLDYLVECGFGGSALHSVILSNPFILDRSLHSFIKPRYEFLKTYLPQEKLNGTIRRLCLLLSHRRVVTHIKYLEKQGVSVRGIGKLLAIAPRNLVYARLVKLVNVTKEFGIEPSATMFIWYVRIFGSMSETSWKKKVELFKRLGWSDEDIRTTLMHYPAVFAVSEEKLRRMMKFYINVVKAEPRDVISQPILLALSLNGRIIPRYEVMKLLKEYDLLKRCKMTTFFRAPEGEFIRRFIEKNLEQVPHLLDVYCESRETKAGTPNLSRCLSLK